MHNMDLDEELIDIGSDQEEEEPRFVVIFQVDKFFLKTRLKQKKAP